jgi:hypothetical protein
MWMWQSVIKLVVGLSSVVVGNRSILFVGGLKDGPFGKDPNHLSPVFGSER